MTSTEARAAHRTQTPPAGVAAALRVGPGFRLADVDPRSAPAFDGGKADGEAALAGGVEALSLLQEKLFAQAAGGTSQRRVLLVLQGMDTSGKGGIMRHVVGAVDPQGVSHHAFKAPDEEERSHDFLWRIRKRLPEAGQIGVFDRSHYEDVLAARVRGIVGEAEWRARYGAIEAFERELTGAGTTVVKAMLHISPQEQKKRLTQRLERPEKHWKYDPGDVADRALWPRYQEAYADTLTALSLDLAPWHVVPADRKWYARWAVQQLLLAALQEIAPQWPAADFDVAREKSRLAATPDTF